MGTSFSAKSPSDFIGSSDIPARRPTDWLSPVPPPSDADATDAEAIPTLVLGRTADADILIRAVESGAVKKIRPVGILSPSSADQRQVLRGIKVLGRLGDLEPVARQFESRGRPIREVVFTPSALLPENHPEALLRTARRLGLAVRRLPSLDGREEVRLAPVNVEDLLLRPSINIDYERLRRFVQGKAVIVHRRRRIHRLRTLRSGLELRCRAIAYRRLFRACALFDHGAAEGEGP